MITWIFLSIVYDNVGRVAIIRFSNITWNFAWMYFVHVTMWGNNGWHITELSLFSWNRNTTNKLLVVVFIVDIKCYFSYWTDPFVWWSNLLIWSNQSRIKYYLKFPPQEVPNDIVLIDIACFVRPDTVWFSAFLNVWIVSSKRDFTFFKDYINYRYKVALIFIDME